MHQHRHFVTPYAIHSIHCLLLLYNESLTLVTCLLPHLSHGDVEGSLSLAKAGGDVDAVDVAVEPLAEHHPVEGAVKLDTHSEQILDQSKVSIVAS